MSTQILQAHSAWTPRQGSKLPMGSSGTVLPWKPAALPVNPSLGQAYGGGLTNEIILPTAILAIMAYVGFRLGKTDHGIPSVLGYVTGTLAALGALSGLLVALGILKAPIFGANPKLEIPVPARTYPIP